MLTGGFKEIQMIKTLKLDTRNQGIASKRARTLFKDTCLTVFISFDTYDIDMHKRYDTGQDHSTGCWSAAQFEKYHRL